MAIYQDYAAVYDRSGQLAFSLKMIPYLARLLERHPVAGHTLLELACGTGTVAVAMAQAGPRPCWPRPGKRPNRAACR